MSRGGRVSHRGRGRAGGRRGRTGRSGSMVFSCPRIWIAVDGRVCARLAPDAHLRGGRGPRGNNVKAGQGRESRATVPGTPQRVHFYLPSAFVRSRVARDSDKYCTGELGSFQSDSPLPTQNRNICSPFSSAPRRIYPPRRFMHRRNKQASTRN